MRSRTFVASGILVSVTGFVLGYFVLSKLLPDQGLPPPSLTEEPTAAAPADEPGWCCQAGGQVCAPAESAQLCIGNGGRVFHKERAMCDEYCDILQIVESGT